MKKILIMTGSMNVGGIEKALAEMLKIIPYDVYDVDLLLEEPEGIYMSEIPKEVNMVYNPTIANCLYKSRKKQIMEMLKRKQLAKVIRLLYESLIFVITKERCRYFSWQCSRMEKLTKAYDVAIAYCNPFRFPCHYILKNVTASKKILWNHTDLLYDKINYSGFKKIYKDVDCFVNVSKAALESCASIFPGMKDKMVVYYNVINRDEIIEKSKEFEIDKIDSVPILLTVGRISQEKGQDRIPDIAHILKQKNIAFKWYVVGGGTTLNKIRLNIKKYNLEENIILTGNQKNPYPYMKMCDIYVQTSWQEGFPMVIGEVLTFEKPCVVTNVGGTMEYFKYDSSVEEVKTNSNECIAESIAKLICDKNYYNAVKSNIAELDKRDCPQEFIKLIG